MIDSAVLTRLTDEAVPFCVIGATALATHGVARFTADVDLLTVDDRVLRAELWGSLPVLEIRRGADDDPLRGVVRIAGPMVHDIIVGRGHASTFAVATAEQSEILGCPVATPIALVLLKLEAGSARDRYDIVALVEAQRVLNGAAWFVDVGQHVARLSRDARVCWTEVEPLLARR